MGAKLAAFAILGTATGGVGVFGAYKIANKREKVKTFTDEEYRLIFKEFKSQISFLAALKTKTSNITDQSTITDGGGSC